jgi:hypothetical protein
MTFKNAKVGGVVFDVQKGWGKITSIDANYKYPVEVDFGLQRRRYAFDGKYTNSDRYPTLFHTNPYNPEMLPTPPKNVNGFKVPGISFTPSTGDRYWYPAPFLADLVSFTQSSNSYGDIYRSDLNACYPHTVEGKEAAKAHSLALLGQGEKYV